MRLNRRLTSDIYLGVVEIKGSAGAPRFEGRGRTLEVAVVMRRLPAERMLDRLVREKAVSPALLDGIGRTVAQFHAAADTGGEIDELGGIETIRRNWEENFAQTDAVGPELLSDDTRRYESPAREPGVIRLDTAGEAEGAVERAVGEIANK